MKRTIRETARLTGVSVRTLQYYDRIGLLKPSAVSQAGYRFYDDDALARLQQVLYFRELGFPLKEIAQLLAHPAYDMQLALRRRRALLLLERQRLDAQLALVEQAQGGLIPMNKEQNTEKTVTAATVAATKKQYADEARARWGSTEAYAQSQAKAAACTEAEQADAAAQADAIFDAFAALRGQSPASPAVQALVARWQAHITRCYYTCTPEILAGLGEMYVGDARFTENLDRHGAGTAQLMHDAIAVYCRSAAQK